MGAPLRLIFSLCLVGGAFSCRQLQGNSLFVFDQRSLVTTFPFNAQDNVVASAPQPRRLTASQDLSPRNDLQGADIDVSFPAVAAAGLNADGKRCIDKVEMVEETEYDDVVQCDHSCDRRCHTTYTTNYESQLVKDCDVQGPEICRTEYESECWTKQEVHDVEDDVVECTTEVEEKCEDETSGYTTNTKCSKWPREVCSVSKKQVKKYTPITGCTKEPRELCAPAGCGFKQGPEECYDKTQTVVQDAPKEQCTLEPQRTCKHVTK